MKEAIGYKIKRFTDGDFLIDIVETKDLHEAWLSHKAYDISCLMFEMPIHANGEHTPYHRFVDLVEKNLPSYEEDYMEDINK